MHMQQSGRRRGFKSWFVEPYRQVKLGLMFLVLNLIFAGSILGIFGFYVWDIYQTMSVYFQLSDNQNTEILQKFQIPILVGAGLILVFVCLSILLSVKYTHRIYGPLVSIHRYLDDYLQGIPTTPLVLRESDQLQELAEKLNKVVALNPSDRRQSVLRPFFRFLDELLEGKRPEPIKLRDTDQFHDLAEKLNRLPDKVGIPSPSER
jgi:hypothetical protein